MIQISHLTKSFDGEVVLDDISLDIRQGEILAILGGSGEGKSVFLQHLIGLLRPDRGNIWIESRDITKLPEQELLRLREKIGYLFQQGALFDSMTIFENIAFPLEEHTDFKREEIIKKVKNILTLVGLEGVEEKYPVELSGGMKKRAALARSIILDSKILFCDEPTSGLDPIRSKDISDLIQGISRKLGTTTVITSHDIPNSFRIADRVALLHAGKIMAIGTKEELQNSKDPYIQEFLER